MCADSENSSNPIFNVLETFLVPGTRYVANIGGIAESSDANEKHSLLRSIYNEGLGGSSERLHLPVTLRF